MHTSRSIIICALIVSIAVIIIFVALSCRRPVAVLAYPENGGVEIDVVELLSNPKSDTRAIVCVFAKWCHFCIKHKETVHENMKAWASENNILVFEIDYDDPKHNDTIKIISNVSGGQMAFPHFCILNENGIQTQSGFVKDALRFQEFF